MKITGELLKSERLKRDLSVQDIAYALKLSQKIINSIEAGDIRSLPAKTFVRGFVKSYADYLKIDSEAVLKQFQEEMGSTHPVPKAPPPQNIQEKKSATTGAAQSRKSSTDEKNFGTATLNPRVNKKNIMAFVFVGFLVVSIALVNKFISKYQKELVQTEDTAAVANPLPTAASTATSSNPSDILNASVPPSAQLEPLSSATSSETTSSSVNTAAKVDDPAAKFPALEPSKGQPVELLIEARRETTIEYAKGNSNTFIKLSLKPNSFQILRSSSGLHLRTLDGGAVLLTVNGVSKGPAATGNKPVQLSF